MTAEDRELLAVHAAHYPVVMVDPTRQINLAAGVTGRALLALQREAAATVWGVQFVPI